MDAIMPSGNRSFQGYQPVAMTPETLRQLRDMKGALGKQ